MNDGAAAARGHRSRPDPLQLGFSLLELMIAVAIIAIMSSIAVPLYASAVRDARIQKCKQELRVLSRAIDIFKVNNNVLPRDLDAVGHGDRRDPWGNLYLYLNFQTGSGSGMDFAIQSGLVDPEAFGPAPPPEDNNAVPTEPTEPTEDQATAIDQVKRKDKFLFPLNTDYDLFSLGPNGKSRPSLGETLSLDDVIRANDGGYFGLASDY